MGMFVGCPYQIQGYCTIGRGGRPPPPTPKPPEPAPGPRSPGGVADFGRATSTPSSGTIVAACRDEGRGRRGCVEVARVPSALREFPLRKGSPQCTLTFFALSVVI